MLLSDAFCTLHTQRKLLDALDPEYEQKYQTIPMVSLQEAIKQHDVEAVERLLELGIHPDMLNYKGHPLQYRLPLHDAIESGKAEIVGLLLKYGADATYPHDTRSSYLELARKNNHSEIVRLLLEYGDDPNQDIGQRSLLHWATKNDQLEIMEILLEAGADPEAQVPGILFLLSSTKGSTIKGSDRFIDSIWS